MVPDGAALRALRLPSRRIGRGHTHGKYPAAGPSNNEILYDLILRSHISADTTHFNNLLHNSQSLPSHGSPTYVMYDPASRGDPEALIYQRKCMQTFSAQRL